MLTVLKRVVPEEPGRPEVGGDENHPMRKVTRAIAAGEPWTPELSAKVTSLFDGLAPEWSARVGQEAASPLADALRRAEIPPGGVCVEVGSGTGNTSHLLVERFDVVISVDISWEMLRHAPAGPASRVRADASRLPLPSGSADAVAVVNSFLFADEIDRVLGVGGCLIWVCSLADGTPIYLPPGEVLDVLPGDWDGITAKAGWGEWLVARRRG